MTIHEEAAAMTAHGKEQAQRALVRDYQTAKQRLADRHEAEIVTFRIKRKKERRCFALSTHSGWPSWKTGTT
jgi:hypothetical protein